MVAQLIDFVFERDKKKKECQKNYFISLIDIFFFSASFTIVKKKFYSSNKRNIFE
jgi:hypothetical protein